jgi:hypothetical protein
LCHTDKFSELNTYGWGFLQEGYSFTEDEWMPSGTQTDLTRPSMSAPLESVKEYCASLKGISKENAGHNRITSKALGGTSNTMTLDIHMAHTIGQVSQFSQLRLGMSGGECTSPAVDNDANFDATADLQCDVATLALKCDLTRVVSVIFGNHQSDFIVLESGIDTNYHAAIHGRPLADYASYRKYFTTKLHYLIQSLTNTEDMDSNSLLDNTILDTAAQTAGVDVEHSDYAQCGDGTISGIFS